MTILPYSINSNHPSPNFTDKRNGGCPKILVMHYTASHTTEASLATLTSKTSEVSAHYLIPPKGKEVYLLVNEEKRAWHAGVARWGDTDDVNSNSIGLENVGWGYTYGPVANEDLSPPIQDTWNKFVYAQRSVIDSPSPPFLKKMCYPLPEDPKKIWHPFPQEQMNTLALLSKGIIDKWSIDPENVVGHADISPGRKVDPGPLFYWKFLAEKGVGVWHDPSTDRVHSNKPQGISVPWMQESLKNWGYKIPQNGSLDLETKNVVVAFQMHFRPERYEGIIDEESMDIIDRLLCQRANKLDPK